MRAVNRDYCSKGVEDMSPEKYLEELANLAFKFRDDDDLCGTEGCQDCVLNRMNMNRHSGYNIKLNYCQILSVIVNNSMSNVMEGVD